jgi:acetyltransferase
MPGFTIRPLAASDRRAVAFTFGRLSERSRYQRYLTTKPALTPRDLRLLLDVDHWHHEALIAYSPPPRAPIGIARYVRLKEFDAAEVAVEVVDGWQRHGVGTALMVALSEQAARAGIRRFHVSMLRDNAGARALARKLGRPNQPATVIAAAGNVVELTYSVSAGSSGPAGSSGLGSSPPSPPTATGVG